MKQIIIHVSIYFHCTYSNHNLKIVASVIFCFTLKKQTHLYPLIIPYIICVRFLLPKNEKIYKKIFEVQFF